MMNWPWTKWTSVLKELNKRKQDCEDHPEKLIKLESVEDFFATIKEYKPTIFDKFKWWANDFVWDVYRSFKPCHQQIRKAIPNRWTDITELIRIVNFELLKSFHDNEMHIIEWNSNELHAEFKSWIDKAYQYITIERPQLEDQISHSYPPLGSKGTYEEKYGELNRLEKLLAQKDTEVLTEMVKKREMFWS